MRCETFPKERQESSLVSAKGQMLTTVFRRRFVLLHAAHDLDDSLEYRNQVGVRNRSLADLPDMLEDGILPLRLINRQFRILLELADLARRPRPLIQEFDQLAVDLVDFLAPPRDIHG